MFYSVWLEEFTNWVSYNQFNLKDSVLQDIILNLKSISSLKRFKEESSITFKIKEDSIYIFFRNLDLDLELSKLDKL